MKDIVGFLEIINVFSDFCKVMMFDDESRLLVYLLVKIKRFVLVRFNEFLLKILFGDSFEEFEIGSEKM